jgi:hypothetical protein
MSLGMLTYWARGPISKIIGYITNIGMRTAYFREKYQLVDHGVEVRMCGILVIIIIIIIIITIIRHESGLDRPDSF